MRIAQRFKTKINEEIKASGISPEQSELDVLLEELTEREEMAEEERFQQGKEIIERSREGERYSIKSHGKTVSYKEKESKSEENSDDPPKKSRRVGSETLSSRYPYTG